MSISLMHAGKVMSAAEVVQAVGRRGDERE